MLLTFNESFFPELNQIAFILLWINSMIVLVWDIKSIHSEHRSLPWQLCALYAHEPPQPSPGNSTAVNQYAASFIKTLMNIFQISIIFLTKHICSCILTV